MLVGGMTVVDRMSPSMLPAWGRQAGEATAKWRGHESSARGHQLRVHVEAAQSGKGGKSPLSLRHSPRGAFRPSPSLRRLHPGRRRGREERGSCARIDLPRLPQSGRARGRVHLAFSYAGSEERDSCGNRPQPPRSRPSSLGGRRASTTGSSPRRSAKTVSRPRACPCPRRRRTNFFFFARAQKRLGRSLAPTKRRRRRCRACRPSGADPADGGRHRLSHAFVLARQSMIK